MSQPRYDPFVLPKNFERTWYQTGGGCYEYTFHPNQTITYKCIEDDRLYGATEYKILSKIDNHDYFVVVKDVYHSYRGDTPNTSVTYRYERYALSEDDRYPGRYSMQVYQNYRPGVEAEHWNTLNEEQHFLRMMQYAKKTPNEEGCIDRYPNLHYSSRIPLFSSDDL